MIPVANGRQHRIVAATVPADVNAPTSLHLVRVEMRTIGVSDQGSRQPDTPRACASEGRDRTCPDIAGASRRTHRARGAAPPVVRACGPADPARDGTAYGLRRI